ncbi:kinase-like domain-containing protein [Mycena vulgaris]|nr:kinase-like domain-containing protein [Mycena vulgaris]
MHPSHVATLWPTLVTDTPNQLQSEPQRAQKEDTLDTLFCRALYAYDSQDASALSFREGDIIEILTQRLSGWWDGLLNNERGWFPSNYVTIITDEEASSALRASKLSIPDRQNNDLGAFEEGIARKESVDKIFPSIEKLDKWRAFWIPYAESDGRVYYLNTRTGQRMQDLPDEDGGDTSDSVAGVASQSVDSILSNHEQRAALLKQGLPSFKLRNALQLCYERICTSLLTLLGSHNSKQAVLSLGGARAQSFLDAVQDVLDKGSLPSARHTSQARRLILKLSEACDQLPSSLFITGVTDHDEHPTFCGGFGDIYRASHHGSTVAVKRIRMFRASSDSRSRLEFCREALVWQTLEHKYVLPLIGIDRESFPSSFCMVSPWMKRGTLLKYLNENGRDDLDKMLLQVAEGLAYLHSMNVVHGDLRGTNILVSDDWHPCLADFGLTTIIDATSTSSAALTSTAHHAGSARWFAPELIQPTAFGCDKFRRTPASDVYAFACVCLELHTGRPPFSGVSPDVAAMLRVIAGERPERPASMFDGLWDVVTAAWAPNFRDRPNIKTIIESLRTLDNPRADPFFSFGESPANVAGPSNVSRSPTDLLQVISNYNENDRRPLELHDDAEEEYWDDEEETDPTRFINLSLLSHIAVHFRDKVPRGTHVKGSIPYPRAFTGKDVVTTIQSQIQRDLAINHGISTNDRRAALQVARSLQSQLYFYEVEWGGRVLQDGVEDVYMFLDDQEGASDSAPDREELPTAVITMLTKCYSPSCGEGNSCYSYSCSLK